MQNKSVWNILVCGFFFFKEYLNDNAEHANKYIL